MTASLVETTVPVLGHDDAIAAAGELAAELATGAAERDLERVIPAAQLDALSASGLLALTVPRAYGGADASTATLTEVVRILARPPRS